MDLVKHEHDVLVVGAGGSGLRASMGFITIRSFSSLYI